MILPYFKFYTRDWQADPELRMCSLEARGFWMECLCIMHNAKRRGFMETPQGSPLTDEQTSRLMGAFIGDLYRCREELLLHGVPSVEEETGVWYCRRMVKETAKALKCSVAGRDGGGNPQLLNKENRENKEDTIARDHISLKVTFKGHGALADMINEVLGCREEFKNLNPETIAQVIHNAESNPRMKTNHSEFIASAANMLKAPNDPVGLYRKFLASTGGGNSGKQERTVKFK